MSAKNPVAGVVIKDKSGRYLLVQEKQPKAYGLWNLPAGWIDEGETMQEAAVREAKEEVGLDVELEDHQPLVSMLSDAGDRMLNSFMAKIIGGELMAQSEELLDARWFSFTEIEQLFNERKLRALWVLESVKESEGI